MQKELHDSLENTLKEYSLWLTSAELESTTPVWVRWIKSANPTYTNPRRQETKIQEEIIKLAEVNPEVSRSRENIMEKQFIQCRLGKTLGWNKVTGEGISIFITSNNYGWVLHLLGMLPKNCISSYYQIIPKTVKWDMNRELYDRLILLNQDEVNKQRFINITNVTPDLFQSMINFHPADTRSKPYEVIKFLHGPRKVFSCK